ncbi:MAG: radical SAM protein [Candidatus Gracilibacteria bacterium]|nr:radical SAM protein [Candidatus Gracilibacteria bacterium]
MKFSINQRIYFDRLGTDCLLSDNKFVKIYNFFAVNNYSISSDLDKSDIVILDLCGVGKSYIDIAEEKANFYYNEGKIVFLIGCISDIISNKYGNKYYYIDSKNYNDVEKYFEFTINYIRIDRFYSDNKINLLSTGNHFKGGGYSLENNFDKKFFIEISVGCQLNCSYCNIKKVKGNTKSLKKEDIINEIEKAVKDGKTEIFLLSDDCGSYGFDIGTNFGDLICDIFNIKGDIKLYITNIYPLYLVKYYNKIKEYIYLDKISYILVPVQHYSSRVLKLMNRAYDVEKIIEILKDIKLNSKTELHNHIIFNYNEETLEEFVETFKYLNYYDKTFYFKYSDVNNIYGKNHISYDLDKKIILLKKLQKKYSIDIPLW